MAKTTVINGVDFRQLDFDELQDQDVIQAQSIDDIMSLSEPWRTNALKVWADGYGQVKLKATKTPFVRSFWDGRRWREFTIQPKGQNFDRLAAIDILYRYGVKGIYRGKDQKTGLSNAYLQSTSQGERDKWKERGITDIPDVYMYHDNSANEAVDTEQDAA